MRHDYTPPDANLVFQGHGESLLYKELLLLLLLLLSTLIWVPFINTMILLPINFKKYK